MYEIAIVAVERTTCALMIATFCFFIYTWSHKSQCVVHARYLPCPFQNLKYWKNPTCEMGQSHTYPLKPNHSIKNKEKRYKATHWHEPLIFFFPVWLPLDTNFRIGNHNRDIFLEVFCVIYFLSYRKMDYAMQHKTALLKTQ